MPEKRMLWALAVSLLSASGCNPSEPSGQVQDELSGRSFYYFDQADRVAILRDLQRETLAKYAPIGLKKARLGLDVEQVLESAIQAELAVPDAIDDFPLVQAASNLDFLDRAQRAVASLHDTHFRVMPVIKRPTISNGLALKEVHGHFYVVAKNAAILARTAANSSTDVASHIRLGDEVLGIDGVSPSDATEALLPYESSSSELYARSNAVEALTWRTYRIPQVGYSDWEIKSPSSASSYKVRLTWYYSQTDRKDARLLLGSRGFAALDNIKLRWNEARSTWEKASLPWEGYEETGAPQGLLNAVTWFGADTPDTPVYRTGLIVKGGRAYGVLQLLTYDLDKVVSGQAKNNWDEPITAFIRELKAAGTPLIIDLRDNHGGISSIPAKILSFIAKPGEEYAGQVKAFRLTRSVRQMIEQQDSGNLPDLNGEIPSETALSAINDAIAGHKEYTRVFSAFGNIKASASTGGFELPVVALVSPSCVSACDAQSKLFQGSGRVKLVGVQSNGTGAGFTSMGAVDSTKWADTYDVLKARIPNHLFGYSGEKDRVISDDDESYLKFGLENRPTVADVQHVATLKDYLEGGKDWFEAAITAIAQP